MSVYQVEEYYISMSGDFTGDTKQAIEKHLSDEGYSTYEFQDDDTTLVIDDIPSESEADTLLDELREIEG